MSRVTAAILVIGDEILSGRTQDTNTRHIAEALTLKGIDLVEVRVVPDDKPAIVEAVNALRACVTYLFTTGGIGPTHDDITADAISAAFGRPCIHDPRAMQLLLDAYQSRGEELTESRARMARMPEGAELIENPLSVAPGFRTENVYTFAGVPKVMQAMLATLLPTLEGGVPVISETVTCPSGEGAISGPLSELQAAHPDVSLGSYPRFANGRYSTEIVVRGRDAAAVESAREAVTEMVQMIMLDD